MRRIKIASLLIVVVAVAWIFIALVRRPARSVKLADGTILRIEKVAYGKQEVFKPDTGLYERMRAFARTHLPKTWAKRIPAPPVAGSITGRSAAIEQTNNDALQIYVSRWDPATNGYEAYSWQSAEIIDEHGCEFRATATGSQSDPSRPKRMVPGGPGMTIGMPIPTLNWMTFESFPRHERQFRLRVHGDGKFVAEFMVENPLPPVAEAAKAGVSKLPVSVKDGDTTFMLKSLSYRTNFDDSKRYDPFITNRLGIVPAFEVSEHGKHSTKWFPVGAELWDSSGNFATQLFPYDESGANALYLCPEKEAWRYVVKFCGLEGAASVTNTTWRLTNVKVPGPGEYLVAGGPKKLAGVTIHMGGLGGIGETLYSGYAPFKAEAPADGDLETWFRSRPYPRMNFVVRAKTPHIGFGVEGLSEDQRLSIRVRDDQGREYYARLFNGQNSDGASDIFMRKVEDQFSGFKQFGLLKDSKVVDLTFTVHNVKTAEFIFKPPRR